MRQDPDILMVAEIRDNETAEIATEAALTGHLVLFAIHTNDAPSAAARLIDMGLAPFLLAAAVSGVMAQRLARRLCEACREPAPLSPESLAVARRLSEEGGEPLPIDAAFYRAVGCAACRNTGYRGRLGLFELLRPGPGSGRRSSAGAGQGTARHRHRGRDEDPRRSTASGRRWTASPPLMKCCGWCDAGTPGARGPSCMEDAPNASKGCTASGTMIESARAYRRPMESDHAEPVSRNGPVP